MSACQLCLLHTSNVYVQAVLAVCPVMLYLIGPGM